MATLLQCELDVSFLLSPWDITTLFWLDCGQLCANPLPEIGFRWNHEYDTTVQNNIGQAFMGVIQ